MPEKLYLIDAHALCYRSYFAIRGLANSKGQATNAVYGFVSTLRKILRDHKPDYLAVCFDVGEKTHRQKKYADYKIQRPSMPDDLLSQIPIIKDVVGAFNLPIFEKEGFEADDVIATLAKRASKKSLDVVIVSDDKDMLQLVNEHIKVFSVRKDEVMGYKESKVKLGIDPAKIVDLIGLAGDKVDNIPGVAGIGEVTAKNLINEFGDLENIFKNIKDIRSAKVKEKLTEQKEAALFSKELSILDANVPVDVEFTEMKVVDPDRKRLFEMFKELEFRRLAQEFADGNQAEHKFKTKEIKSSSDFKYLIQEAQKQGAFAIVYSADEGKIAVSSGKEVFVFDKGKLGQLKGLLESKKVLKVLYDSKEIFKVLFEQDIDVHGRVFDVFLAAYLVMPAQSKYDIDSLAWAYLETSVSKENLFAGSADLIFQIQPVMDKELNRHSLIDLFDNVEVPLAKVLAHVEATGVCLDNGLLSKLSKECGLKIDSLEKKLYALAGEEFNLNSPKQLSKVLFEKLKLPVIKKTKTGFSTDEGVLLRLSAQHELPALILEYRQLAKLKSTYIDALPKLVDSKTKRLHATFNQVGTETGRLSSNNPNLQNIPIKTELGREIRRAFIPSDKNNVILSADYSQIELRILAHLSQDKNLIKAFQDRQDIHQYTASLMFDVKEKDVTAEMRYSAKRVNFGIVYGMSAFGLAKDLGIPNDEAQGFIDRYFSRYPGVKKFMDDEIKKCQKEGYVLTILKRRRYIPEINNRNVNVRQFAQRQAVNTPVQGSAADLMKLAMINVQKTLDERNLISRMISTVHDELVFDVPKQEEAEMVKIVRKEMEESLKLSVPVEVSIKVGKNWLDTEEV